MKSLALLAFVPLFACSQPSLPPVTAAATPAVIQEPAYAATTGTLIALNKKEDTASIIDLATGKTLKKVPTGPNPNEVAFSPSGRTAVVADMGHGPQRPGKTLTVIELPAGKVAKQIDLPGQGAPHGLIWLDEARVLMTSHESDSLVVVNVPSGKMETVVPTGQKGTHLVVLSPDKKRAYTSNVLSATVSVVDLEAGKLLKNIPCGKRAEGISISPDGKTVAVGNMQDNNVSIIDAASMEVTKTLADVNGPIRTSFTNDGRHLLVSSIDGLVVVYDGKTFAETARVKLGEQKVKFTVRGGPPFPIPMNFAAHADGRHMFVVMVNADTVAVLDTKTMEIVAKVDTGSLPDGVAWSPVKAAQ
jgi:YVTN family beta-propeller protein